MRIADLILELAKQPLDAEVMIRQGNQKEQTIERENIVYAGEVKRHGQKESKKTVLINLDTKEEVNHIDLTTMETSEGTDLDVVFFPPFTARQDALEAAIELKKSDPSFEDFVLPTLKDVGIQFIEDNEKFEDDPGEERAYLYSQDEEKMYAVIEVPFRIKEF